MSIKGTTPHNNGFLIMIPDQHEKLTQAQGKIKGWDSLSDQTAAS